MRTPQLVKRIWLKNKTNFLSEVTTSLCIHSKCNVNKKLAQKSKAKFPFSSVAGFSPWGLKASPITKLTLRLYLKVHYTEINPILGEEV